MTNFASRNKISLTVIIILSWIVLSLADYKIEGEGSTPIQWVLFASMVVSLVFIHLIAVVNEVEYEEEYYQPNLQDKQTEELTEEQSEQYLTKYGHLDAAGNEIPDNLKKLHAGWAKNPDGTVSKTVFVVQPIHVTQDEFEEKINNKTINMEKKAASELKAAQPKPEAIKNYSVGHLPTKYRAIYMDVCGFATSGLEDKSYDDLIKKVRAHGHQFKEDRPHDNLIAFELPFLRLPKEGYFGVK